MSRPFRAGLRYTSYPCRDWATPFNTITRLKKRRRVTRATAAISSMIQGWSSSRPAMSCMAFTVPVRATTTFARSVRVGGWGFRITGRSTTIARKAEEQPRHICTAVTVERPRSCPVQRTSTLRPTTTLDPRRRNDNGRQDACRPLRPGSPEKYKLLRPRRRPKKSSYTCLMVRFPREGALQSQPFPSSPPTKPTHRNDEAGYSQGASPVSRRKQGEHA